MTKINKKIVARCIDDGIHVPLVLLRGDVHAPADELEETALKDIHLVHLDPANFRVVYVGVTDVHTYYFVLRNYTMTAPGAPP